MLLELYSIIVMKLKYISQIHQRQNVINVYDLMVKQRIYVKLESFG